MQAISCLTSGSLLPSYVGGDIANISLTMNDGTPFPLGGFLNETPAGQIIIPGNNQIAAGSCGRQSSSPITLTGQ